MMVKVISKINYTLANINQASSANLLNYWRSLSFRFIQRIIFRFQAQKQRLRLDLRLGVGSSGSVLICFTFWVSAAQLGQGERTEDRNLLIFFWPDQLILWSCLTLAFRLRYLSFNLKCLILSSIQLRFLSFSQLILFRSCCNYRCILSHFLYSYSFRISKCWPQLLSLSLRILLMKFLALFLSSISQQNWSNFFSSSEQNRQSLPYDLILFQRQDSLPFSLPLLSIRKLPSKVCLFTLFIITQKNYKKASSYQPILNHAFCLI